MPIVNETSDHRRGPRYTRAEIRRHRLGAIGLAGGLIVAALVGKDALAQPAPNAVVTLEGATNDSAAEAILQFEGTAHPSPSQIAGEADTLGGIEESTPGDDQHVDDDILDPSPVVTQGEKLNMYIPNNNHVPHSVTVPAPWSGDPSANITINFPQGN